MNNESLTITPPCAALLESWAIGEETGQRSKEFYFSDQASEECRRGMNMFANASEEQRGHLLETLKSEWGL